MLNFIRNWLQRKIGTGLLNKWAKIRESPEWAFVHPWERRFVNEKLAQGWETWTDEDVQELSALIFEIGKRSISV